MGEVRHLGGLMRAVFFLITMSCCLSLGLGLYTLLRKPVLPRLRPNALETIFAAFCLVIAAGSFGSAFFVSAPDAAEAARWFHAFAFSWYFSPPLFLLFSIVLSGFRLPRPCVALLFLPGSLILAAHLLNQNAVLASVEQVPLGWHANYTEHSYWHWANVFNYSVCALAAMGVLVWTTLTTGDRRLRIRAGIVLFTLIPAFFGTFATGFVARYFGVSTMPPMMPLFLSILVVGLAVALFRYDLLELTPTSAADRILASVRDAVALVSMDGRVIYTNLSCPAGGLAGEERMTETSIHSYLPTTASGVAWLAERATSNAASFETDFAFAPDRLAPAAVTIRSVAGPDGGPLGYIVSAHDLTAEKGLAEELERRIAATTALRSVEERISRAFRASPAGMLIVEGGSRIVLDANEAAARIFGLEIVGIVSKCTDDLGFRVAPEDLDPILERLDHGEPTGVREFTIERYDGVRVQCLVAASPLAFGGKEAVVFSLVDVTELDRLRDAVAKSQKLDSIGMLAGGLAHDFNNILTAVMGNLSLARLSMDDRNDVLEAIDRAEAACQRARDLAGQLLTFSKGGDPSPEPTNVLLLLREAVRMATAGSSVAATFSNDSKLPLALVDPGQIMQTFNNIALNAVQAMSGGGTLFLRTRLVVVENAADQPEEDGSVELPKGNYIAVDFRDEGPGIPAELLGRIFDPYVTTKRKGSGLGLAICYSILKRHHGAITVSSEPGRGTSFTVYLPAARSIDTVETREEEGSAKRAPTFGKGTVLLMDDDLAIRTTSERMLTRLGYEPKMCISGDTAVTAFAEARESGHPYSAVILDLTVPAGMGGVEAAKLIREMDPAVPIYVSSGYAETPVLADYASFGFDGVIPKPYGIEELGRKLAGE